MTIQELQDAINKRLEKFDGRKFKDNGVGPEFHGWYVNEIREALEESGIEIFRPSVWKIIAEVEGPGDVRVWDEAVAEVKADVKKDGRYNCGGPGKVLSIRVSFCQELRSMTIEEARAFILRAEISRLLDYYKNRRKDLAAELNTVADKIAELTAIEIV